MVQLHGANAYGTYVVHISGVVPGDAKKYWKPWICIPSYGPAYIGMYNFLLINGQILAYIQIPNIKCKFKLGNLKEAEEQTKIIGLRLPSASFLPKKRIQLTVLEIKSSKKPHISTKPL